MNRYIDEHIDRQIDRSTDRDMQVGRYRQVDRVISE